MSSADGYKLPPGTIVFGPKGNCTLDICPLELSVYGYRPSLAANITFICLYSLAMFIHAYLGVRWKSWWFLGCMIVGCINAMLGYAARVAMFYNPFNFAAFMIQISMCSIVTDVLQTDYSRSLHNIRACLLLRSYIRHSSLYVRLSCSLHFQLLSLTDHRLYISINHFSRQASRFEPKLFYQVFIPSDLTSLVLQACGGGLSTASAGKSTIGVNITIAGLAFQVFTIVVFIVAFADYLVRYSRSRRDESFSIRLRLFFGFTGLAILLITARCVYRLVELRQGYTGHGSLLRDEGIFIGLEGV